MTGLPKSNVNGKNGTLFNILSNIFQYLKAFDIFKKWEFAILHFVVKYFEKKKWSISTLCFFLNFLISSSVPILVCMCVLFHCTSIVVYCAPYTETWHMCGFPQLPPVFLVTMWIYWKLCLWKKRARTLNVPWSEATG